MYERASAGDFWIVEFITISKKLLCILQLITRHEDSVQSPRLAAHLRTVYQLQHFPQI